MTIKAIRTTYEGIEFRSRTEARWAVFFDTLEVRWNYEAEGYDLPSGWYVPDFWLPEQQIFWEIKGKEPTEDEAKKADELAAMTGNCVYIAWGQPEESQGDVGAVRLQDGAHVYEPVTVEEDGVETEIVAWDCHRQWCVCPVCGQLGVEFDGRGCRICNHPEDMCHDRTLTSEHPRILRAVEASKRHSFWDPK